MPSELSTEAVSLLAFLMPGFAAAWVLYGLTSHPKPGQFERVIQALILTFIVQSLVPVVQFALLSVGRFVAIGAWSETAHTLTSLVLALALGTGLAYIVNKDSAHKWFRSKGFTSRTSHPSEWYCVLSQKPTFVVLQLIDGRRLYGWPKEWPIERDRGQFYIQVPSWITEEGEDIPLTQLDGILIDAKDVGWVEVLHLSEKPNDERTKGLEPSTTAQCPIEHQSAADLSEAATATEPAAG